MIDPRDYVEKTWAIVLILVGVAVMAVASAGTIRLVWYILFEMGAE